MRAFLYLSRILSLLRRSESLRGLLLFVFDSKIGGIGRPRSPLFSRKSRAGRLRSVVLTILDGGRLIDRAARRVSLAEALLDRSPGSLEFRFVHRKLRTCVCLRRDPSISFRGPGSSCSAVSKPRSIDLSAIVSMVFVASRSVLHHHRN